MSLYTYRGKVERIIDGDTVQFLLDLGFSAFTSQKLRLLNVWAAERGEMNYGEHTKITKNALPIGTEVLVHTIKDSRDKYGRYVANIFIGDECINEKIQSQIGDKFGNV